MKGAMRRLAGARRYHSGGVLYRMVGAAFGPHPGFRTVAVLVFTTNEVRETAAR